jgi:rfaE bifunctional protein kinase chain/domain
LDYNSVLNRFKKKKIMVIGDIVADEYIYCITSRISREAPVLILKYEGSKIIPGGAGNSINNIHSLGGELLPVGLLGRDEFGIALMQIFEEKGIRRDGIIINKKISTVVKSRILAGGLHTGRQQIVRIDREKFSSIPKWIEDRLLHIIDSNLNNVDAILISDYGYGLLSNKVIDYINKISDANRLICVDSRYNVAKFKGVTVVTPNEPEVEEALNIKILNDSEVIRAGRKLMKRIKGKGILITRGKKGMALFERGRRVKFIPIFGTDDVTDVTGAGDTVISVLTLSLASGATLLQGAIIANCAAGLVVMRSGPATINLKELEDAVLKYEDKDS